MGVNGLLNFASTMKSLGGIFLAVIVLLAMVTIHEFGHYVAGKILGFKINEFSVGFGPALLKKRSKKTGELFALRVVPLGGYCAFDGEDEEGDEELAKKEASAPFSDFAEPAPEGGMVEVNEANEEDAAPSDGKKFNDQPPWKRIIVLVAGATMNYLLALVLIIVMFTCCGQPLYRVMARPEVKNEAGEVIYTPIADGEAYRSGLVAGDIVETVNGKQMYLITDFLDAIDGKKAGDTVPVVVLRATDGGRVRTKIEVVLQTDANFESMSETMELLDAFGIWGLYGTPVKQGWSAVPRSLGYSVKIGGMVLRSFGELLTGKMALTSMGGPLTTIEIASEEATSGVYRFLNIASFIGVNLAVFNLLPIPALDGSKVIFCIIEWIRKKPVNRKVEAMIHFVGIIALFGFAILVDVLHFLH